MTSWTRFGKRARAEHNKALTAAASSEITIQRLTSRRSQVNFAFATFPRSQRMARKKSEAAAKSGHPMPRIAPPEAHDWDGFDWSKVLRRDGTPVKGATKKVIQLGEHTTF